MFEHLFGVKANKLVVVLRARCYLILQFFLLKVVHLQPLQPTIHILQVRNGIGYLKLPIQ